MALPLVRSSKPHFSGKSMKSNWPSTPYTGPTSGVRYAWQGNADIQALQCNAILKACNQEGINIKLAASFTCKTHSDTVPLPALCLGCCCCSNSWPSVWNSYAAELVSKSQTWLWAFQPGPAYRGCKGKTRIVSTPYVVLICMEPQKHPDQLLSQMAVCSVARYYGPLLALVLAIL